MLFHRFRQFAIVPGLLLRRQPGRRRPVAEPSVAAAAQDQQSQAPAEDDNLQTFKAQVNVVNLFFNVKDKHGMLIPNLTKNDFEVLEDGKPQTIKYFSGRVEPAVDPGHHDRHQRQPDPRFGH